VSNQLSPGPGKKPGRNSPVPCPQTHKRPAKLLIKNKQSWW
jgi:hypothetical protein